MKILLELNGWFKEEDIPRYSLGRGRVEATLYPPMNMLASDRYLPAKDNGTNIIFTYSGKHKNGMPIFQYEN